MPDTKIKLIAACGVRGIRRMAGWVEIVPTEAADELIASGHAVEADAGDEEGISFGVDETRGQPKLDAPTGAAAPASVPATPQDSTSNEG